MVDTRRGHVYHHRSCLAPFLEHCRRFQRGGAEAGRKAESRVVGDIGRFLHVGDLDDGCDRAGDSSRLWVLSLLMLMNGAGGQEIIPQSVGRSKRSPPETSSAPPSLASRM